VSGKAAQLTAMKGRSPRPEATWMARATSSLPVPRVTLQKVRAYGDPRLFAMNMVADRFATSAQPIVPERLLVMGGSTDGAGAAVGSSNVFTQLMALLLAEKAGIPFTVDEKALAELDRAVQAAARNATEPKGR
jgi:hypothetical protein